MFIYQSRLARSDKGPNITPVFVGFVCCFSLSRVTYLQMNYLQPVDGHIVLRSVRMLKKEMFYLTTHSTHFIYGYMASGMW